MKRLNLTLNLTKLQRIHQVLSSGAALNLRKKYGAEQVVTPELLAQRGDNGAVDNTIATEILKNIHGAMKHLGITETIPAAEWKDFRDKTALHMWEYSLPKYDPEIAQFNTFVFNHVKNMWANWQRSKSTRPLDQSESLDAPIADDVGSLGDVLPDPLALDFKSEVEAQIIESALLENIENPRLKEILSLWISEDPRMGPTEKRDVVAKKYNAAHPQDTPLQGYRVYRIMMDEVYPLVLDQFPEMASSVNFQRNPDEEPGLSKKWIKKPKPPEKAPEETLPDSEEAYVPLEERFAPAYRIDPQTGERTLISLNMRRKVTAAQEVWCHNLLTFLSIEQHGKFRRSIKSSSKR